MTMMSFVPILLFGGLVEVDDAVAIAVLFSGIITGPLHFLRYSTYTLPCSLQDFSGALRFGTVAFTLQ